MAYARIYFDVYPSIHHQIQIDRPTTFQLRQRFYVSIRFSFPFPLFFLDFLLPSNNDKLSYTQVPDIVREQRDNRNCG